MSSITQKIYIRSKYDNDFTLFGIFLVVFSILAVTFLIVSLIIILSSRAIGRTTCENWSAETGIESKFVILNFTDSGTCLAKTPDGRWVLNSKWQAFVSADSK